MTVTPFGAALRALLLSDADLAAALGERVHPQAVPAAVGPGQALFPALTYLRIGGAPDLEHAGLSGLHTAEVQLDVWALDDAAAEAAGLRAQVVLVDHAPGFRHQDVEFDSAEVVRDRGVSQDKADRTDDEPVWRHSFDVSVSFRRPRAA